MASSRALCGNPAVRLSGFVPPEMKHLARRRPCSCRAYELGRLVRADIAASDYRLFRHNTARKPRHSKTFDAGFTSENYPNKYNAPTNEGNQK